MEVEMFNVRMAIATSCFVLLLAWAWRVLDWAWFTPKRIEKRLRQQGFTGNPYRFLIGDVKESEKMLQEAQSKPMEFGHDIFPRVMPHIDHTIKTYGTKGFSWVGRIPRIYVLDPVLIKEMLTQPYKFHKNFVVYNPLARFLLTGIGSFEGEKWSTHRRIISPAFTLEKLKNMVSSMADCYAKEYKKWEQTATKEGSVEVDAFPIFDVLTSDVISKIAFGSTYDEGVKIFLLLKELMDLTTEVMREFYIPGWRFLPTKRNNRMKAIDKEIKDMLRVIINKRIKAIKEGEPSQGDLLGVLLESNFQEIQKQGNKKNAGMTIEDVIAESKLFYFAGQETTGVLITWALIMLSKYRDWQDRARKEVLEVFGKRTPDFEGLNHLKYVTMIVYEVLRLYPPVIDITKVVPQDTKLGPYTIPAGTQIMMPTILIHRQKHLWGEDAMEFNPMRFADGVAKATNNQTIFLSFTWGPRICLGQNFAVMQAKLALTMILQRFTFDVRPTYAHAPFPILSLQPQYGSHITYKKLE